MRRVIIGENKAGRAVVLRDDDKTPRRVDFDLGSEKFNFCSEIWATNDVPVLPGPNEDLTLTMTSFVPPPGGTRCRLVVFPTEKDSAEIQRLAAERGSSFWEEFHKQGPGFEHSLDAETGMHITDSIDYGFIAFGQIDLELDDGIEVHLNTGDSYVQQGTRHAWHNRYDGPCGLVVFMVGTHKRA